MKKEQYQPGTTLFNQHFKDSDYSIITIQSKGKEHFCLVDIEDYNLVNRYRWNLQSKGYAVSTINGKTILMHRLIMGVDDLEIQVDHKHHNKLDNRRANIRVCTRSENRRNSRKLKESHSKYKGVYKDGGDWHTQIMQNSKVKNLGRFRSELTAAKVYDHSARETFKEFAFLNFPEFIEVKQLLIPGFL